MHATARVMFNPETIRLIARKMLDRINASDLRSCARVWEDERKEFIFSARESAFRFFLSEMRARGVQDAEIIATVAAEKVAASLTEKYPYVCTVPYKGHVDKKRWAELGIPEEE